MTRVGRRKKGRNKKGGESKESTVESRNYGISDIVSGKCDGNQGCKSYFLLDSWPLSDDIERTKILQKIRSLFQLLIKHKYLADIEITEKIIPDESRLLLDERSLGYENGDTLDTDALLSWIFTGPKNVEQLRVWKCRREDKSHQGMEILQMLKKEFYHLQSLCERKCDHLIEEAALQSTGGDELHRNHETVEQASITVECNGETPDSEIVVARSSDALDEHEEELRRREIELEAEEKKLEETLEYQRRIEDEAKQN